MDALLYSISPVVSHNAAAASAITEFYGKERKIGALFMCPRIELLLLSNTFTALAVGCQDFTDNIHNNTLVLNKAY